MSRGLILDKFLAHLCRISPLIRLSALNRLIWSVWVNISNRHGKRKGRVVSRDLRTAITRTPFWSHLISTQSGTVRSLSLKTMERMWVFSSCFFLDIQWQWRAFQSKSSRAGGIASAKPYGIREESHRRQFTSSGYLTYINRVFQYVSSSDSAPKSAASSPSSVDIVARTHTKRNIILDSDEEEEGQSDNEIVILDHRLPSCVSRALYAHN